MIRELSNTTQVYSALYDYQLVGGGSINQCYELNTDTGKYFIKTNVIDQLKDFFKLEVEGLRELTKIEGVSTLIVRELGELSELQYVLMDFVQSGKKHVDFFIHLGKMIATLHQQSAPYFGWKNNNYIGTLVQNNTQCASWSEFFITQRLEVLHQRLFDLGIKELKSSLEVLYKYLPEIFPPEPPSLLHGDLWSENFLCNEEGFPVLIDPAVYYGHREMDLAMTKLFGGFPEAFYQAYNEQYPLEKNWEQRIAIANLYPLMVHSVLFGDAYLTNVKSTLSKFN